MSLTKELISKYIQWVRNNPQKASEAETLFKWASYFLSGRVNSSAIPTEVAYTLSNLIVLVNDQIIRSATTTGALDDGVRLLLTTLEYCEVIFEISAQRLWGNKAKWLTVAVMQTVKAVLRLSLFQKYHQPFNPTPAISPLNREQAVVHKDVPDYYLGFELKTCKRVIRKVEAAPKSTKNRLWEPLNPGRVPREMTEETRDIFCGELVHIMRPIGHLMFTYKFGEQSWKPWLYSLILDCGSLLQLRKGSKGQLTLQQRNEYSRRVFMLLMYILRSPFYERHSQNRITSFLNALSRIVPLARFFCEPTKSYIPFFQSTYSYVWST